MKMLLKKILPKQLWEGVRRVYAYVRRLILDLVETRSLNPRKWIHVFFLARIVRPAYSMIPTVRLKVLYNLSEEIVKERIPGAIVECGSYNGGSAALLAAAQGQCFKCRDMWLFDSFEGLPPPTDKDGTYEREHYFSGWCKGGLEKVQEIFTKLHLSTDRLHIVAGWFQDTFATGSAEIDQIALLHIDADWYESVKICLEYFYPKLVVGGYVEFDDYGKFPGCKKAVHEYLTAHSIQADLKIHDNGMYFRKK